MLAVVCEVTGASPDGVTGLLIASKTALASNIINDKRRQIVANEATKLLSSKRSWCDITYPLGTILSAENGQCRVIYQYFDANQRWIKSVNSQLGKGSGFLIVFQKSKGNGNSSVKILSFSKASELKVQLEEKLECSPSEIKLIGKRSAQLQPELLEAPNRVALYLPIGIPQPPVLLIGRHRVAIELVRQLALLPITVKWMANQFHKTDPTGPLVTKSRIETTDFNSTTTANSMVIIMTEDHQLDLSYCEWALKLPSLKFVGCIGSVKKAGLIKQELLSRGLPKDNVDKLQMPIGSLSIKGKHPSLIAASVVAQILTVLQPRADQELTNFEQR